MLTEQKGVCHSCGKPNETVHHRTGEVKNLCVDHDHETGKVRRLLCTSCNMVLGLVNDNPKLLRFLADYVEEFK